MKMSDLEKRIIYWRRDFHQYPETGFLEMRTASKVASELDHLGFKLKMGLEVMSEKDCMGKPSPEETKAHVQWAIENGANTDYLDNFSDGFTGIVATMDTGKEGPTVAFRFDMDALDINESNSDHHAPYKEGFRSVVSNKMHACGHDAHTAIGLGLATIISANKSKLVGKMKLIFQPAEEGTRGAKSMVQAGVVDDVDFFIASHIGAGIPHNQFVAATNGFLATTKMDVTFRGRAAHAGSNPEEGQNALLAAAAAALHLNGISRHSKGATRINVGTLRAGEGRNVIAQHANMQIETRGETTEINQFLKERAEAVLTGSATMYGVDYSIETVGEGVSSQASIELALLLQECGDNHPTVEKSILEDNHPAGSEDATYFMNRVQENGGMSTYCFFGTNLAAGHHNEAFDIDEDTLLLAAQLLYQSIVKINEKYE